MGIAFAQAVRLVLFVPLFAGLAASLGACSTTPGADNNTSNSIPDVAPDGTLINPIGDGD